ncbi:MAG: phosphoribosylformylglycinamidine synthase subunit PurL [Deltaproteobacteria bacterium]|nr:phosphoribosylformylglycinamidine synthase subunit PurL [Deltaproteobacteria bacterium]
MGLKEGEFKHIKEVLGREISILELGVCSALFSEHCSYKSTKVHLKNLPTTGPRVLQGPGENAGVVDIGDGEAVVFKIESHNHPSFIEPYQGAATGVGGILRDVFTMGARPIALMNALRFGSLELSKSRYLLKRAVAGIGGYGNCMGIPTVGGELWFHESYDGNCLVNAFALGIVDTDKIFLGQASGVGNSILYVGSKTGRDGIHGATMASESFDDDSEEKRPTVQVGDPFQEKLLLEACLEVFQSGAVVGIQDMGAAGMTSSTYEMADRAGTGVRIELDKVPQREEGMNPYEIMLSESQERMLLVVERGREEEVCRIFEHWELSAVKIGEVVDGKNVDLYWHGELVSSIPVAVLTSAVPQYRWPEKAPADYESRRSFAVSEVPEPDDLGAVWLKLLASENICSRRNVYRQYDSTVRTNTVIHPGGDAAVVRVKRDDGRPEKGIAMTLDCNSLYCSIDPRQGTALSLAEAYRNITAVGATPLALSDCLNFGSPEREDGMWQIAESIRGMAEAAKAFDTPIISGNVSLYNETKGKAVYPTPMLALVGLIEDASKCVTIHFKKAGDAVFVLGPKPSGGLGGSEYMALHAGVEKGELPALDYERELKAAALVRKLIDRRLLSSCHDISSGGLAAALAECCFGEENRLGAVLECSAFKGRKDELLFSESGARYIVSSAPEAAPEIEKIASEMGIEISIRGIVGGDKIELKGVAAIPLDAAYNGWLKGLDEYI